MPIRIRYKVQVVLSSSSSEEKDLGNNTFEVVNDEQNEGGTWRTVVPAGAVDMRVQLGNVAQARFIMIRTTAKDPTLTPVAVTIKFNDTANDAQTIRPVGTAKEGIWIQTVDNVTALYASNAGSTDMVFLVSAAGD